MSEENKQNQLIPSSPLSTGWDLSSVHVGIDWAKGESWSASFKYQPQDPGAVLALFIGGEADGRIALLTLDNIRHGMVIPRKKKNSVVCYKVGSDKRLMSERYEDQRYMPHQIDPESVLMIFEGLTLSQAMERIFKVYSSSVPPH